MMTQPMMLRADAVAAMTGLSTATLDRWTRAGRFPAPVMLSSRLKCWPTATVLAWLASKEAESATNTAQRQTELA